MDSLSALTRLAEAIQARHSLEELLQLVADGAAEVLEVKRISVRLLDASRSLLLASARAGEPLHEAPVGFRLGEGLLGWIAEHGEPLCLPEPEHDPRFMARPGMASMGAFVGVPIRIGAQTTGVISAVDDAVVFDDSHRRLLTLVAAMCAPHVEIARLARLAHVDPLTGALNRRGIEQQVPTLAPDDAEVMSVAMVDVDHFKRINDSVGHAAGDLVLRQIAATLTGVLRAADAVVRYGGEEFLLVLPGVAFADATAVAERVRAAVAAAPTAVPGGEVGATVSIGVAERRPGELREAMIARADAALYAAKAAGRNRVHGG
ncbi:MAG: sensor domain-containing diguanylate cyclase [Myxococcales bacterium]|nr:sensor domain-containing diguanylate cyclase [Myxococcales bacterium]